MQIDDVVGFGEAMAKIAIAENAAQNGRTFDEQMDRTHDHAAYQAAEMDSGQKQLDDFEGAA